MVKHLYVTRLSEFGTNDLIVTNRHGHVIDYLPHACRNYYVQLSLDHILFEGKVYSLETKGRRRALREAMQEHHEPRILPVMAIDVEDASGCISDSYEASGRTREFLDRHFDLSSG